MNYQTVLEMEHRLGSLDYLNYQGTENKGLITEKPLVSNLLKPTDITDLLVNASVQETLTMKRETGTKQLLLNLNS